MSDENNTDPSEPVQPEPKTEPSNIEKYNAEKKKEDKKVAKAKEKAKDKQADAWLNEAIEARKTHAPQYVLGLIEGLDPKSQLVVLKAHDQRKSDPNTSSIGTPIGRVQNPLEQYMKFNPTKDSIEWNIPASKLMNSENNKELLGID